MRFYRELAHWWPLFSPPDHYGDEAADLLPRLGPRPPDRTPTLLELGCGGGSLASHLGPHFRLTLTDLSPGMLAVSRATNPEAEHLEGDMRTLRLDRRFDVVLLHDAVMYLTTEDDLLRALQTAAAHCAPGGRVVVLPDFTREIFRAGHDCGGEDGSDGRAFRYLEWTWDPDPSDSTYLVDYAFLFRNADGTVTVEHDRHVEGLFSRASWLQLFREAGLEAAHERDGFARDVFIARPDSRVAPPGGRR